MWWKEAPTTSSSMPLRRLHPKAMVTLLTSLLMTLKILRATKIYYRVKVISASGNIHYSATVTVNSSLSGRLTITPNPFGSFIQVQTQADKNVMATMRIVGAGGQTIYQKNVQLVQGQNCFTIDGLSTAAKGVYFFELQTGNTITRQKMMKQ